MNNTEIMANAPSEQLRAEYSVDIEFDQPLTISQQQSQICEILGEGSRIMSLAGHKVVVYRHNSKNIIILHKAITYLGNPHPLFKKRIQIPKWWKDDIYAQYGNKRNYEIIYLGVYHYEGLIIFVNFEKSKYVRNKSHNSSAHVYINDLYQGLLNGVFRKIDQNGNLITSVRKNKFKSYLDGDVQSGDQILNLFTEFNQIFPFGEWIEAQDAITEMKNNGWNKWRETEWAGWYLEYMFDTFTEKNNVTDIMRYVGSSHKVKTKESEELGQFDFDIWFDDAKFYGDLKASDNKQKTSPGNDQETFIDCINRYGKFWYVIFGHNTVKDKDCKFEATKFRSKLLLKESPAQYRGELSYGERMKNKVQFDRMCIIEINRVNFRQALIDFNQGHQPDGAARKKKFLIKKNEIDNFVIYRYGQEE